MKKMRWNDFIAMARRAEIISENAVLGDDENCI
jgi:hypothetical protein